MLLFTREFLRTDQASVCITHDGWSSFSHVLFAYTYAPVHYCALCGFRQPRSFSDLSRAL